MTEPLATLTEMNALEMDFESRIVEVVLNAEFLTMTDERAIIILGLKTGADSSLGKSVQAPIRFVILHSVYDYLGRPETASERTTSTSNTTSTMPLCPPTHSTTDKTDSVTAVQMFCCCHSSFVTDHSHL